MKYSPHVPPDPTDWLDLDEGERIALIDAYHRRAHIRLPAATLHAAIHAVIETQLAMQLASVVDALARLQRDGLDRHDALHAIGSVLAEHLQRLQAEGPKAPEPNLPYFAALDELSAASWRRQFDS